MDDGWRVDAARLLGEAADVEAVKPLIDVLKNDDNSSARISAAVALAKIGDMTALNALEKAAVEFMEKHVLEEEIPRESHGSIRGSKMLQRGFILNPPFVQVVHSDQGSENQSLVFRGSLLSFVQR